MLILLIQTEIDERSPAQIEGYTSQTTLEMDRLQQRIKELETEVRISKLREKDLYSKFLELKLHPPSISVSSSIHSSFLILIFLHFYFLIILFILGPSTAPHNAEVRVVFFYFF